jgi:hypothetical protein
MTRGRGRSEHSPTKIIVATNSPSPSPDPLLFDQGQERRSREAFDISSRGRHALPIFDGHNMLDCRTGTGYWRTGSSPNRIAPGNWATSAPVLFDFTGPADVIDLLQSAEVHLSKAAGARP